MKKPVKQTKQKDTNIYPIADAIKKAKESSKAKFDATVEIHINLALDKKSETNVRFTTVLPHGTGKSKKVAVLSSKKANGADLELMEADIDKIEKGKLRPKVDFDVLIAEPKFMPKLAKVAKILGPAGMMPNPKLGTVTEDIDNAIDQQKRGKIEIKTEKDVAVIHSIIGKVSFDDNKLIENFEDIINNLKNNRPAKTKPDWINTVYIATSMGPSFAVKLA